MAISNVKATVNGTQYALTLNSQTGNYEATITAPNKSSYNQTNHYYGISVTAYDDSGNHTTVDTGDSTFGNELKLYVKEKVVPTITITSPTDDALIGNNKPTISWKCADTDSGVNKNSIDLLIDNVEVTGTITATQSGNTFNCSYIPTQALGDGAHTLKFKCTDNDGNSATKTITITVDTVPPTLNVSQPTNGIKTNVQEITVSGTTNDLASSPVTLTVNGKAVTVNANGSFSTTVSLALGENTIIVVARDGVGKTTTITRTVYFNNTAPTIESISITPNPVDAGKIFVVSVSVSDE